INVPTIPETTTMWIVCNSPFQSSAMSISGAITEHLRGKSGFPVETASPLQRGRIGGIGDHQRTVGLAADLVDRAGEDVDVRADLGDEPRGQGLEGGIAEEDEPHQRTLARCWLRLQ